MEIDINSEPGFKTFEFKTRFILQSLIENFLFEPISPETKFKLDHDFKTVADIIFPGYEVYADTTLGSFEIVSKIKFELNGEIVYNGVFRVNIENSKEV